MHGQYTNRKDRSYSEKLMTRNKVKNKSSKRGINLKLCITKTVKKLEYTNYQGLFIRTKKTC